MKKVIALLVAMSTTAVFAGVDYASKYIYRGATVSTSAAIQPSMDTNVLGLALEKQHPREIISLLRFDVEPCAIL